MNVLRRVGGGSSSNAQQQQQSNSQGCGDAAGLVDSNGQPLDKHFGLENVSRLHLDGFLAAALLDNLQCCFYVAVIMRRSSGTLGE